MDHAGCCDGEDERGRSMLLWTTARNDHRLINKTKNGENPIVRLVNCSLQNLVCLLLSSYAAALSLVSVVHLLSLTPSHQYN